MSSPKQNRKLTISAFELPGLGRQDILVHSEIQWTFLILARSAVSIFLKKPILEIL